MLSADDVQHLARAGRVAPHPDYHAHQHSLRFEEILAGLGWCLRVEPDTRQPEEDPPSLDRYVAWCPYKGTRVIRVDFTCQPRQDGDLLLVVTAFEVRR